MTTSGVEAALSFVVDWNDTAAAMTRQYQLTYHPSDRSVELFDLKNRRTFLKRCHYPHIDKADLFVGANITVYARQLKLTSYGDAATAALFAGVNDATVIVADTNKLIDAIRYADEHGINVKRIKSVKLPADHAVLTTNNAMRNLTTAIAIEVSGANIKAAMTAFAAAADASDSITSRTVTVSADTPFDLFKSPTTARGVDCTIAVIKPHSVRAKQTPQILRKLNEHFTVSAIQSFKLDNTQSAQFMEVYKGVIPDFHAAVDELADGQCIALELQINDKVRVNNRGVLEEKESMSVDAVSALRALCGPVDPVIARTLRPETIRAVFGVDKVKNAIHCTDLVDDGPLESEFFFKIM